MKPVSEQYPSLATDALKTDTKNKQIVAEIIITRGNPDPQEIAVITALFTVLSARAAYLNKALDKWPSPECDAKLRGPNGTYVNT